MMKIFQIAVSEGTFFFTGPARMTEERFKKLCLSHLDQCAALALSKAKQDELIAWQDIMKHLPNLLAKSGFIQVEPVWVSLPSYDLAEGNEIRSCREVVSHNSKVRARMQQALKESRELEDAKVLSKKPDELARLRRLVRMAGELAEDSGDARRLVE